MRHRVVICDWTGVHHVPQHAPKRAPWWRLAQGWVRRRLRRQLSVDEVRAILRKLQGFPPE